MIFKEKQQQQAMDLLQQTQQQYEALIQASSLAVQSIQQTMKNLAAANDGIDALQSKLDGYIQSFQETQSGLRKTRDHNEKVTQNLRTLLAMDEEDAV